MKNNIELIAAAEALIEGFTEVSAHLDGSLMDREAIESGIQKMRQAVATLKEREQPAKHTASAGLC